MHVLALTLCLLLPLAGQAEDDLAPLLAADQLAVDSSVNPDSGLVPGQRASLVIEVATSTWFTGGTQIRIPEVPGLVILQTEQFAANTSETRAGQTWVVQRWTLDLYPQRAGDFTLPPIQLSLQVNGGDLGDLSGNTNAPPVSFSVAIPPPLAELDFWVAAPRFSVSQRLDRDTGALAPGDAFERVIEFRGEDVLAMMLPDFSEERRPGLAAYPAPPELENRSNRGESSARRVQRISYVAEQPGDYLLPAADFFWWDTERQVLSVLTLDAIEVHVAGDPAAAAATAPRMDRRRVLEGFGGLLLVLALGALALRYRPWRRLPVMLSPVQQAWRRLMALRRPALPERLNPGSNAVD